MNVKQNVLHFHILNMKTWEGDPFMLKRIMVIAMAALMPVACAANTAKARMISGSGEAKKLASDKIKNAFITDVDREHKRGRLYYEVELHKGDREYTLEYRASDGKLVKYEWDIDQHNNSSRHIKSKNAIRSLAKQKVKHARIQSIRLDRSDKEYKVKMKKGKKKYTLEYDAGSGKLISYEWKISA